MIRTNTDTPPLSDYVFANCLLSAHLADGRLNRDRRTIPQEEMLKGVSTLKRLVGRYGKQSEEIWIDGPEARANGGFVPCNSIGV